MTTSWWRLFPAVLMLLALAGGRPAGADEALPDLATIRENVRVAAAVPHTYRRTTVTTSSDGLTTTLRRFERGDDSRTIEERGPFHTEYGTVKGEDWHQNDNGQTVVDAPDPGAAKADPTTTKIARVHTPVEAFAVTELNARGEGTRDYVDPATWRLVRRERVTINGVVATVYDDFREDGGRVFAHHWATDDRYAVTKSDTRVTAYDTGPVADADVAMPESRRRLVEFPPDSKNATLPVRFVRRRIVVRAVINGRGLDFLLDTGASEITIDNGVAHQLGLTPYGLRSAVTAGRYTTARTIIPEMSIGTLRMHKVAVQMVPEDSEEQTGIKTVGLVGFDFISELGLTIDYEHQTVTAVQQPFYVPPTGPHVIALDVRVGDGAPFTNVTINGKLSERFLLDTGGSGTFIIFDGFARKHPEALVDLGGGGDERLIQYSGVGGEFDTRPYQLASLRLGPLDFQKFVGYRVISKHAYEGPDDGLIGVDFLRLFTVGLDYLNARVYLVPNKEGRAAMGIK